MSRWLIVVGLVTMAAGIGTAGYGYWTIWEQHRAITSARAVKATVLDHQTKDLKASGFKAKVPLVRYEYSVDGTPYTSDTVTPSELMLPDAWAESVFQAFPIGVVTEARYDPHDPSKAFLIAKYSVYAYLPVLIGMVIAALGLGVIGDQLMSQDVPKAALAGLGGTTLTAKQHHLTRARVLGMIGLIGLVFGGPAIVHHLLVSTSPHERMGFLMEGAYGIAVAVVLFQSAMGFRRGAGFGTPVVSLARSATIGQPIQLHASVLTRFKGMADLHACLKCEAKDTALFSLSEEKPDAVLLEQQIALAPTQPVSQGGEIAGTAEFQIPEHMFPSTPSDSREKFHTVWSLTLTASGSGGRKAESVYIVPVIAGNAAI